MYHRGLLQKDTHGAQQKAPGATWGGPFGGFLLPMSLAWCTHPMGRCVHPRLSLMVDAELDGGTGEFVLPETPTSDAWAQDRARGMCGDGAHLPWDVKLMWHRPPEPQVTANSPDVLPWHFSYTCVARAVFFLLLGVIHLSH